MTDHDSRADAAGRSRPSLLMVSTVSSTLGFVIPYALHFRQLGWRVDAAANGAMSDPALGGIFDQLHELPLSRSILDAGGILRGLSAISRVLEANYDIVHVHSPIAGFVTRAAVSRIPRGHRPSVAYTAHGFHFHERGSFATNTLFLTAERVAGRWTDRLIVINDQDYAAALRHRIVSRRRLVLMPGIGVDTDWYSRPRVPAEEIARSRARLGINPGTPLFAVVGELSIRKRPFDVVAALGQMRHRECHVVLLGDGPERPRVEATIQKYDIGARAHLLGSLTDVRPAVAGSVALVLASSREGLPRSTMEALSLEVPVITTDARGNPDLVAPDAGLIVSVADIPALAAAMDWIVDHPAEARSMGQCGRARMVDRYELGILIAQHQALYLDLLAQRAG